MNFLIDAHLPRRMAAWLTGAGCDAIHTLDLPDGNRTNDEQVNDVADRERRAVISKDADFVDTHILRGRPAKLLLISTGNLSNRELESLVVPLIPEIVREFGSYSLESLLNKVVSANGRTAPYRLSLRHTSNCATRPRSS